MKRLHLLTFITCALTACRTMQPAQSSASGRAGSASAPNQGAPSVLNTTWALRQLNGKAIDKALFPRRVPYFDVNLRDSSLMGFTGCNRFGGSVQATANTMKIGPLQSTKMACANGMSVETEFITALEAADSYKIDGKNLTLLHGSTELMTLGRGD